MQLCSTFISSIPEMLPYDSVNRWTANKLDAVVMAPE
jgi:hypothetical protein